ncbi:MAG TPA: hypothetical protein VK897_05730 [Anaerolineales bacterium]|nr:hypothetical protein [Anaerolineales bacterium]
MKDNEITLFGLTLKAIVAHTLTYFLVGLIASTVFDYQADFARPELRDYMRQIGDPIIAFGPALQPIRGIIFALVFFPLRDVLFRRKNGWLTTWWLLVALGILSTFGPTPGSVEGAIYTTLPIRDQFLSGGMLEILSQSFLFSGLLYYWVNHPEKRWMSWVLGILFALVVLMSIMGYLAATGAIAVPS